MTKNAAFESPWILRPRVRPGAKVRLFAFPYSGASASIFFSWSEPLPNTIELAAVQLPGRGARLSEPSFTHMPELIDALAPALLPLLDRPFALFGHSLGAVIAFELTRRLRDTGANLPVHLIVSGHTAPQIIDRRPHIHALPDHRFVSELRKLNGTPEEVLQHEELLSLLIPTLRADFALSETYVYKPAEPFALPITAFGGLNDSYISRAELAAWQEHTTAPFRVRMFSGDHFFINDMRPLVLQAVARELAPFAN